MAEYPNDVPILVYRCERCDSYWERSDLWAQASSHGFAGLHRMCTGTAQPITDPVLQATHRLGGWDAVVAVLGEAYGIGDDTSSRSARMAWKLEYLWP